MKHNGKQFNQDPFSQTVSPEQQAKNRADTIKFEKLMEEEHNRGDENWPPVPEFRAE